MADLAAHVPDKRDLTSGSLPRTLLRLAAPIAAGHALHALYNMVDAFWLGKVSKEALAAPAVSMPLLFVAIALGMGFGSAGTALVAQHTGAGRHRDAARAAAQTMLLLSAMTVALAAPIFLFTPWLFGLFHVPTDAMPHAVGYMRIVAFALPLITFHMSYAAVLRALGDVVTPLLILALTNVINMALDPVLIFGLGGFPALGTRGAALATLISRTVAALACLFFILRRRAGLHITRADLRPDWPVLGKTFRIGLPAAIGHSSASFGFAIYMRWINSLGTAVIDAFTVGFRLLHLFRVPAQAMAMAAAPVVGQSLGAGKPALARRSIRLSMALVAGIMFPLLLFLMLCGKLATRAFIDDPAVIAEAGKFFLVVPISSYFFSVLLVLMAAFYGSGHTMPVMLISIVRLWFLRLPLAYVFIFVAGWGSLGAYAGMAVANIICAALTLWVFLRGGWQTAVVPTREGGEGQGATGGAGE